ncbi:radical SAM/SPASM domain-containing protein [Limisalsivibrio acetivorans]|uniref:radical SAM/SPASM domain-containing protein n=1 Tax=Limisalsivibrio acetivorans TaxID=1304888 RepID=UPI0003B41634|nr:radical SAM protein [Limisalsivibrio acetivorans]
MFVIARCQKEQDVVFARKAFEQLPEGSSLIIMERNSGTPDYDTYCAEGDIKLPHSTYRRAPQLLSPTGSDTVIMHLSSVDADAGILGRALEKHRASKKPYSLFSYNMFTKARFEFINKELLATASQRESEYLYDTPDANFSHAIWPDKEDFSSYYKDNFERYFAYPQSISLQLTPKCNKRCPKCLYHSPELMGNKKSPTPEADMPIETAEALLKEISGWSTRPVVSPSCESEPYMYRDIERFISSAEGYGIPIHITTNGTLLNEQNIDFMLGRKNLHALVFSVDALSEETYSQMQPPGRLKDIEKKILYAADAKKRLNSTALIYVNCVISERNREEFSHLVERWIPVVDGVSGILSLEYTKDGKLASLPPFFDKGETLPCKTAWDTMYIYADGSSIPCDKHPVMLGNVLEEGILNVWRNERYKKWRESQLSNSHNCHIWSTALAIPISENGRTVTLTPFTYDCRKT